MPRHIQCWAYVFIALSCLAAVVIADETAPDEAVITITGDNWAEVLAAHPRLAVEFYAPWCGHCKKLAPEWEAAAQQLKSVEPAITLAKCDATEGSVSKLVDKYGVKGYPTLKIFRDGDGENPSDYSGPRTADGIVTYLSKQFGPASAELADADAVGAFIDKPLAVLAVFPTKDAAEEPLAAFTKLAEALRNDIDCAHVFDPSIVERCAEAGCDAPRLMLFKQFEEEFALYEGEWETGKMKEWVMKASTPKLPEMDTLPHNRRAVQQAVSSGAPLLVAMVEKGTPAWDDLKAQMLALAEAGTFEGKPLLADVKDAAQAMNVFGIKAEDIPALGIWIGKTQEKYVVAHATGEGVVKKMAEQFADGTLEKFVKSEEIPTEQPGPVTVVVGKSFKDIVMSGKDVLIEFYAPWCGHCKKLTPIYEKVAEAFKDDSNIVIAKMDSTANDTPLADFKVTGFPTIYFVQGKTGKIMKYSGDRSEESLIDYVKENASGATDHTEL